jgi:hypothetical protein
MRLVVPFATSAGKRNAAARGASDDPALTNPTTGIAGCCARAASGHAAAAAPPSSVMNPAAFQIDRIAPDPRWPGPGCRISNLARISQEAAERFLAR